MEESFFSGLSATDNMLPIHLYYRLLKQAHNKFKMFRPSICNSKISADIMKESSSDFIKTPLSPPVTKVIVHKNKQMSYMVKSQVTSLSHGTGSWKLRVL